MASNTSGQQPLVLSYDKRRFDGGPEVELIQQIETQLFYQAQMQYQAQAGQYGGVTTMQQPVAPQGYPQHGVASVPMAQPMMQQQQQQTPWQQIPPAPEAPKPKLLSRLYKATVVPYIELILGISGVMIALFMTLVLAKNTDAGIKHAHQMLIRQSVEVIQHSVGNIVKSPVTVVKAFF